ncbi:hypothetical protein C8F01DRAFT_1085448 [Mycena amicta]|nr:hypothetical protein C8F01DRAFT_1085448 [Mycena amicta]
MSVSASSSRQNSLPADLPGAEEAPEEETRAPERPEEDDNDDNDSDEEDIAPAGRTSKLKGWARGVREDEILKKHIEPYRRARQLGTHDADDYLQMVVNEYCYRIPYDLPDGEEPPLPLREWTPTTSPDDDSHLTKKERKDKAAWIVYMIPRIKRWLDYRAQGGAHATPATGKKLDPTDPINIMLFQIADTLPAHRARQGWQQFWHEEARTTIEEEVAREWPNSAERKAALAKAKEKQASGKGKGKGKAKALDTKPTGAYRQSIARALFAKKSKAEQKLYLERAAADRARDAGAFNAAMKAWPPKDPVAIQAAIDNLAPTIGRFMQGVAELTNMHVLMTLGGPSPRFHGTLHTAHFSAGQNNAPSPVAFPDWDAKHFNTHTLDKMKAYLRTAYSREECMAAALPENMCIGSREDAWASLSEGPAPPATLDDADLIRMSPTLENGEESAASSRGSDEEDEVTGDDEPGDESEAETGGKRKRTAGNSAGKGKNGKRARREVGDDETPVARTRKRKSPDERADDGPKNHRRAGTETKKKSRTSSAAAPRVGIITGMPRPLPRRAYRKPDLVTAPAVGTAPVPEALDKPASQEPSSPHAPETVDEGKTPEEVAREKDTDVEEDGQDEELVDEAKSPMACAPDASQWVQEIWSEISGEYVTRSYSQLLEAFLAFERAHGWSDGEKALSATGRPKQVKDWIRADRKATARLTKLHKRYDEEFWIWWKVLQPQWRKAKTDWPAMDAVQKGNEGESWTTLRVPGKNGLVSVVASLYWWGRDGVLKEGPVPEWSRAVKDVTWALHQMASSGGVASSGGDAETTP